MAPNVIDSDHFKKTIRTAVDDLKTLNLDGDTKQKEVHRFYAPRVVELGEAALLLFDLVTPLATIARVLCEDAIIAHFAALSEENAAECINRADKAQRRFVRSLVLSGNSLVGKTVERETLEILEDENLRGDSLEEIAKKSGVKFIYDRHFRLGSGELHGSYLGAGPDFHYSLTLARGTAAIALILASAAIKHPTESSEVARLFREFELKLQTLGVTDGLASMKSHLESLSGVDRNLSNSRQ
jgi:hypothetical protein